MEASEGAPPEPAAGGLVAPVLVTAAALALPELWLLRALLRHDALDVAAWDAAVAYAAVLAKTLLLLAPGLGLGLALTRAGRRGAWPVVVAWSAVVFAFLAFDLAVASITGNHLIDYARYLDEPDAWQWAGSIAASVAADAALRGLAAAALAVALLGLGRLAWRRAGARGGPAALVAYALALAAPTLAAPTVGRPLALGLLERRLLVSVPLPLRASAGDDPFGFLAALGVEARGLHQAHAPALERARAPRVEVPPVAGRDAPDVVVLVAESLRRDALDPRWTPRLDAWSRRGLRLERHVAAANCSHLGLFALLYGQSPLVYKAVTRAGAPSPLFAALRAAGYRTALATGAEVQWESMERYLSAANFDEVVVDLEGAWPERDRRTLARVAAELARPRDRPVAVVAFLMSTHFDYPAPPGYDRHQPAAADGATWIDVMSRGAPGDGARARWLNRYRNALAFVDDAVGDLLDGVDPARTVVALTGDHGESFDDDGTWLHSSKLSDAQLAVPFVLAGPGVAPGRRAEPSSHLDLLPTLVRALGGRALDPTAGDDLLADGPPGPVLALGPAGDLALLPPGGGPRLLLHRRREGLRAVGVVDHRGDPVPFPTTGADLARWRDLLEHALARAAR